MEKETSTPRRRAVALEQARNYRCPQCHESGMVAAFVLAPDNETVVGRFANMEDARLDAAAPDLKDIARRLSEWETRWPLARWYDKADLDLMADQLSAIVREARDHLARINPPAQEEGKPEHA